MMHHTPLFITFVHLAYACFGYPSNKNKKISGNGFVNMKKKYLDFPKDFPNGWNDINSLDFMAIGGSIYKWGQATRSVEILRFKNREGIKKNNRKDMFNTKRRITTTHALLNVEDYIFPGTACRSLVGAFLNYGGKANFSLDKDLKANDDPSSVVPMVIVCSTPQTCYTWRITNTVYHLNGNKKKQSAQKFRWRRMHMPVSITEWKVLHPSFTFTPEQELWVFGDETDLTQILSKKGRWVAGPKLPYGYGVRYGTLIKFPQENQYLLTGFLRKSNNKQGAIYDFTGKKKWSLIIKSFMPTQRWNNVGFAWFKKLNNKNINKRRKTKIKKVKTIILAGGCDGNTVKLFNRDIFERPYSKTSTVYLIIDSKFENGPKLPRHFEAGSSISVGKVDNKKTYLVGGSRFYFTDGLIEFDHKIGEFKLTKSHFHKPRFGAAIIAIPGRTMLPQSIFRLKVYSRLSTTVSI